MKLFIPLYRYNSRLFANAMPENIVGDSTDPKETLRPNMHPEIDTGDHYEPLFCSEFN
jgi:hypothetical protein